MSRLDYDVSISRTIKERHLASRQSGTIACVAVAMLALMPTTAAQGQEPDDTPEPTPTPSAPGDRQQPVPVEDLPPKGVARVNEEAGFDTDIAILAAANPDIPVAQIRESMSQQIAVGELAFIIGTSNIAWIERSRPLSTEVTVVLKGDGNEADVRQLTSLGATVETGARFSRDDQTFRAMAVSRALEAAGVDEFSVTPTDHKGTMLVEVTSGTKADRGDIADRATAALRNLQQVAMSAEPPPPGASLRGLNVNAEELAVESEDLSIVERPAGSLSIETTTVRGGQYLAAPAGPCTSAWTVEIWGYKGYLTAGHCMVGTGCCSNLWDPAASLYDTAWWFSHFPSMDIGIALDNAYASPWFWANSSQQRLQGSVGLLGIDDQVCVYGRKSNTRFCSRTVTSTTACKTTGYGTVCALTTVSVDTGRSICPGDSGSGESWNTTMFGVLVAGSPSGANGDCNADPNTNYTTEYLTPMTNIVNWIGAVPL